MALAVVCVGKGVAEYRSVITAGLGETRGMLLPTEDEER